MSALPSKLSDVIELAVRDLEACEADPRYVVDMNTWHETFPRSCGVCLAGAVMAKTLETPWRETRVPADFPDDDDWNRLWALNSVRKGHVDEALHYMGTPTVAGLDFPYVVYGRNPEAFKTRMREVARDLRKLDL